MYDLWDTQSQEQLRLAIRYIDQETNYDIDLFWENAVRRFNIADLYRTFTFNYVIAPAKREVHASMAVVVFISYVTSFEYVLPYLSELKTPCHIIVCAEKEELVQAYRKHGYECRVVPTNEYLNFIASCADFDYVCMIHDNDLTLEKEYSYVGKSYFYSVWENLLKNSAHVAEIGNRFAKEPRLGFLAEPPITFGRFLGNAGKDWGNTFGRIRRIVERLDLCCQISEDKPPYRVSNNFWIRGTILTKVKQMNEEDIPALPYLWSYLAQDAGCYSGIVESAEYAAMNEANLQRYIDQLAAQVRRHYGEFNYFYELLRWIALPAVLEFTKNYSCIYVYGTGGQAKQYEGLIPKLNAYIVSDGQKKAEEFGGLPVKYLSEVDLSGNCGIVLCLNRSNQQKVIPLLKERGFEHYFCV